MVTTGIFKEPVDGRSLVPLLSGGPAPADWRRAILLEQFTFREMPQGAGSTREPSETTAAQGIQEYPSHLGLRTPTYKYVEYAKFEEKPGFKLMFDWSVYVRLYEWGGKWAVVGFISFLAVVCLTVSAFAWRKLRKMPRDG